MKNIEMKNAAKANRNTTAKTSTARQGTITVKKLTYEIAQQALDEEAANSPRQWSMHPYCGGFINALFNVGVIDRTTAEKLWAEFARGI